MTLRRAQDPIGFSNILARRDCPNKRDMKVPKTEEQKADKSTQFHAVGAKAVVHVEEEEGKEWIE